MKLKKKNLAIGLSPTRRDTHTLTLLLLERVGRVLLRVPLGLPLGPLLEGLDGAGGATQGAHPGGAVLVCPGDK